MSITKTICATAAAAVCFVGISMSAASAQDYRHGEFRRFEHEKHRFGPRCMYKVEARGSAEKKFFGGRPGGKAEARAIAHWEAEVSKSFGPQYASWGRAQGKSAGCRPRGPLEIQCVVAANPCRDR